MKILRKTGETFTSEVKTAIIDHLPQCSKTVSNFLYSTFHLRFPLWHKKWIFCDNRGAVINGFIFEKKRITLKYNFGGNWLNWLCYLAIM
jgi:hypothetical protein